MRDDLIRAEYRKITVGAFTTHSVGGFFLGEGSVEVQASVSALLGTKTDEQKSALEKLVAIGVDPGEVLAAAYASAGALLEVHERKLAVGTCEPNLTG